MTVLDFKEYTEAQTQEAYRRILRKCSEIDFVRFKDVGNSLKERHNLRVSFTNDLQFIRFHSQGNVCCVPFTHMCAACFGTKTVDLGTADGTRTFSLFFLSIKPVYLQAPSKREAKQFLEAVFWIKFGHNPRPIDTEELRRAVTQDHIYVYREPSNATSETSGNSRQARRIGLLD
eukprot:g37899.t1